MCRTTGSPDPNVRYMPHCIQYAADEGSRLYRIFVCMRMCDCDREKTCTPTRLRTSSKLTTHRPYCSSGVTRGGVAVDLSYLTTPNTVWWCLLRMFLRFITFFDDTFKIKIRLTFRVLRHSQIQPAATEPSIRTCSRPHAMRRRSTLITTAFSQRCHTSSGRRRVPATRSELGIMGLVQVVLCS